MCKLSLPLHSLVPQHALSRLAGWFANSRKPWLKNYLIHYFLNRYAVDLKAAIQEDPYQYASFNLFFTRHLKPELRPIAKEPNQLVSPADGCISQIGAIEQSRLFQAKGFYFNLNDLLGGKKEHAELFTDGQFATFYLAPKDYHRVHMPLDGTLKESIYIPGKLFSVNKKTAHSVPNLFSRNERLVCLFETVHGPMAVILVGAMLVGSIKTVWNAITKNNMTLKKGDELGHFEMGSTVIILFANNKIKWLEHLQEDSVVQMGQSVASVMPACF